MRRSLDGWRNTSDVAVGVEWELVSEQEKWDVVEQLPLILAKHRQLVLGHHLRLLHAAVVQEELARAHQGRRQHIDAHFLEVPV